MKGFTLVELLISIAIITLLTVAGSTFQRDVFSLNNTLQMSLSAQLDSRHLIKNMVAELRSAAPSANGAYPLALASSTGITFYSDIDGDGIADKVRYYLNGKVITKGVIIATGTPVNYNGTEKFSTSISTIVASSTLPIFQYYDSTYTGTTTPLTQPVDVSKVRLVKITLIIDKDLARAPATLIVTSQVSLRNLKDNL